MVPRDLCADLAFINGKVIMVNKEGTVAEAVAVKGGKILRVGFNESVLEVVGESTDLHDLKGLTVLPGLIDSHMHPGAAGAPTW